MENLSELSGYVASTLVLLTFIAKDMRVLRTAAIFSNLAFITYGTIEWLPPVLFLHYMPSSPPTKNGSRVAVKFNRRSP
jgi:hypothetical protein